MAAGYHLFKPAEYSADQGGWMMAMARTYSRATHQTAALVLFQTGHPQLLVFGVKLGVFAGLNLSAVIPGEAKNWDKSLPIAGLPDLGTGMDQAGSGLAGPEPD